MVVILGRFRFEQRRVTSLLRRLKVKQLGFSLPLILTVLLIGIISFKKLISASTEECVQYKALIDDGRNGTYQPETLRVIFIGGMERSGSGLGKTLLESYSGLNCNTETGVLPAVLAMHKKWTTSKRETTRLDEAHVTHNVLLDAYGSFATQLIVQQHLPGHERQIHNTVGVGMGNHTLFCVHESEAYEYSEYINELFPNAKFIFIVRDGRAVVHSLIQRKSKKMGYVYKNYEEGLRSWSFEVRSLYETCTTLGPATCRVFKYEDLILFPRLLMQDLLLFLDLPVIDAMIYKSTLLETGLHGDPDDLESLSSWVGKIPKDLREIMELIAPSLDLMGYDPASNSPMSFGSTYSRAFQNSIHAPDSEG